DFLQDLPDLRQQFVRLLDGIISFELRHGGGARGVMERVPAPLLHHAICPSARPAPAPVVLSVVNRSEALDLLHEYAAGDSLRKHAYAVAAAMRAYARRLGEDEELWEVTGLLHDFDYERYPNAPEHTRKGAEILRQRGVDERIVRAILSH